MDTVLPSDSRGMVDCESQVHLSSLGHYYLCIVRSESPQNEDRTTQYDFVEMGPLRVEGPSKREITWRRSGGNPGEAHRCLSLSRDHLFHY